MKRSEKYVEMAGTVPYSREDLILLKDMVYGAWDTMIDEWDFFTLYDAINSEIDGTGTYTDSTPDDWGTGNYKKLNLMQFMLVYFRRVFLFLRCVPPERVPLYVADGQLKVFCEWRLRTGN